MKKLLYILNVAKRVNNFSYTSMIAAQRSGIEFHIAGNWSYASDEERTADEDRYGIKIHQIDFFRTPYHPGNRKAYIQLRELVQRENYDVIHCNTPIGGVLGRVVGKLCKTKKVIYQAHGFHFYKGAPKKNWLLYYSVEKWLAHYSDALITINQEDYELAKTKLNLRKGGKMYFVHGVGIDAAQYSFDAGLRVVKRKELGLSDSDFCVVSVGRLDLNKNNETLIRAIGKVGDKKVKLILCGDGGQREHLENLAVELDISDRVVFLGNRTDMKEIYCAADALGMASFREGLSRTIMEAMASGLPCVASKIRGNVDLIEDGKGGYLRDPDDVDGFAEAITAIASDDALRAKMRESNLETIKDYDISVVEKEIREIYREVLAEN